MSGIGRITPFVELTTIPSMNKSFYLASKSLDATRKTARTASQPG
jgi:hypothetical protein